jgi:hypothetical protein
VTILQQEIRYAVYPKNPLTLVGKPTVGDGVYKGECAAIAQFLVPGLGNSHVAQWRRGEKVQGNSRLLPGTVIVIFDCNGRYIGTRKHVHSGGLAHAALYVRQSPVGIDVVHQFTSSPVIRGTLIRFHGSKKEGHKSGVSASGKTPEDSAENYCVVEL